MITARPPDRESPGPRPTLRTARRVGNRWMVVLWLLVLVLAFAPYPWW
jgi:hypothetical protein